MWWSRLWLAQRNGRIKLRTCARRREATDTNWHNMEAVCAAAACSRVAVAVRRRKMNMRVASARFCATSMNSLALEAFSSITSSVVSSPSSRASRRFLAATSAMAACVGGGEWVGVGGGGEAAEGVTQWKRREREGESRR